jgi:hypothetical protein
VLGNIGLVGIITYQQFNECSRQLCGVLTTCRSAVIADLGYGRMLVQIHGPQKAFTSAENMLAKFFQQHFSKPDYYRITTDGIRRIRHGDTGARGRPTYIQCNRAKGSRPASAAFGCS